MGEHYVSIHEIYRRQKLAEETANKLFKKVEERAAEIDKKTSHLPYLTRAITKVCNCLLLWLYERYPDEILWFYQHGSNPCLRHVWMFDEDVNTAIALLKDENKAALAEDVEGRWQNITQKAINTDQALRKLREHYDRDEDNPAYADNVKESLYEIKADVSQLGKNLFEVAKQQASEAKTELEQKQPQGKGGQSNGGKVDPPNEKSSETWYWKLYETTLKVLVDAVLERFWPKPK